MNINSPFVLLVLQATPFCNIDCNYCYLPDRLDKNKFDISLIPQIMENLGKSNLINGTIKVNWHAGEPTVLNTNFYTQAFELFDKNNTFGVKIEHSFQTNGTLLTQEYCDFIKKYNVSIGISIDGPKHINDKNRNYRNGNSSFDRTIKGINLLKQNKIEFSIIAVLTEYSLDYPLEIFNFFKDLGAKSIGFNVEENEGINKNSSMGASNKEKYRTFFKQFNKFIKESKSKIQQREYLKTLNSIIYQSESYKNGLVTPLSTITIDTKGNFTVFSPELLTVESEHYDNFIFGNIKTNNFNDIFQSEKFNKVFNDIKKGVELCKQTCEFFSICGGGSPSNKLHENGTFESTESNYCIYNIKIPTEVVLENLEN